VADLVKRSGPRPFAEIAPQVDAILDGLAVAHNAGIIHRDLKPENILIDRYRRWRIADFGIANALGSQMAGASGTPNFAAPEQLLGEEQGVGTDLYAIAGIVIFALSGNVPFAGEDGRAILAAQLARLAVRLGSAAALARLLAPEAYGLHGMAAAVFGFLHMARDGGTITALNAYLAIAGEASAIDQAFAKIAGGARFKGARDYYAKRLFEMEELGLNPRRFHFAAGFGRELEYYTGFTFQIEADTPLGPVAVAGGGRYDNLLSDMGAPAAVPAVGCAIHTDRLKAVLAW
jgi:serine/threonine protein kinase